MTKVKEKEAETLIYLAHKHPDVIRYMAMTKTELWAYRQVQGQGVMTSQELAGMGRVGQRRAFTLLLNLEEKGYLIAEKGTHKSRKLYRPVFDFSESTGEAA